MEYTLQPQQVYSETVRDFTPTTHGINIVGGFATINGKPIVMKKVPNKPIVYKSFLVDELKPLFGLKSIGEYAFPLKIDENIEFQKAGKNFKLKDGLYLIQNRIPSETWGDYTTRVFGNTSSKLWLPIDHPDVVKNFLPSYLYRMVVGIQDPGPGNFIIDAQNNVYGVDETSAFSPKLSPFELPKYWLTHNLTGKEALTQLREYVGEVDKIQKKWEKISSKQIEELTNKYFPGDDSYKKYILENIHTLGKDFRILVGLEDSEELVESVAGPSNVSPQREKSPESKKKSPVKEIELSECQFPMNDFNVSYYRKGYGGIGIGLAKSGLQKQVRRGLIEDTMKWMMILLGSFKIENLWNRLLTIVSEDLSLGNLYALEVARKYHEDYIQLRDSIKKDSFQYEGKKVASWRHILRNSKKIREGLARVITVISRSPKTRIADHMVGLYSYSPTREITERELYVLMDEAGKEKSLDLEMCLVNVVGSFLKSQTVKERIQKMRFVLDTIYDLVPEDRKQWVDNIRYIINQRNKSVGKKAKGGTNLSEAILLLTRPDDQIGYKKIPVRQEEVELPEIICRDLIDREFEIKEKRDGFEYDNGRMKIDVPNYLIDKHVKGARDVVKDTINFIEVEGEAIVPKWEIPNPYREMLIEKIRE